MGTLLIPIWINKGGTMEYFLMSLLFLYSQNITKRDTQQERAES